MFRSYIGLMYALGTNCLLIDLIGQWCIIKGSKAFSAGLNSIRISDSFFYIFIIIDQTWANF